MFSVQEIKNRFAEECTACGVCMERCPMIPHTTLQGVSPEKIMEEVKDLFGRKRVGELARLRIYSCLYCNTCASSCPQGLNPAHAFAAGKGILREVGDLMPKGVSSALPLFGALVAKAIASLREVPGQSPWLITDVAEKPGKPVKTLLFPSCFGLIQREAVGTAVKVLQRIDPGVKALGGVQYCCGELQLIAGRPEDAEQQFASMVRALDFLAPEEIVIFCPTCKMNFDGRRPTAKWRWTFITDFLAAHLNELGPLHRLEATVTVHDSCHFVRGVDPASDSPRRILKAIPGLKIVEMENRGQEALCCGGYAIAGTGEPGMSFRDRRLKQAQNTGASILGVYCPGCHMVFGPQGGNFSLPVESVLTILGESLRIA